MTADGQNRSSADRGATWANVVLCILILLAVGYGVKRVSEAPDIGALLNPGVSVSHRVESLGDHLRLTDYRFELNQATNIADVSFTIANTSDVSIRDIVISCDYLDRAGNHHGRGQWVVYDALGPNHQQQFQIQDKRYIPHQATPDSIVCRIVDTGSAGAVNNFPETASNH